MDSILIWIFGIFIVVVIFLSIREIVTWYFKIDTIVRNQETQIQLLRAILKEYRGPELTEEERKYK